MPFRLFRAAALTAALAALAPASSIAQDTEARQAAAHERVAELASKPGPFDIPHLTLLLEASARMAARDDLPPAFARARAAEIDRAMRVKAHRMAYRQTRAFAQAPATLDTLIQLRALTGGWEQLLAQHAEAGLPRSAGVAPLAKSKAAETMAALAAEDRRIADGMIETIMAEIDAEELGARMTQAGDLWEAERPRMKQHAPDVLERLHTQLGDFYNAGRDEMYERVCSANLKRADMGMRDGPEVVFATDTAPFGWMICKFAWNGLRIDYTAGDQPELTFSVTHARTNFESTDLKPFKQVRVKFKRLNNPAHVHDGVYYGHKAWIDGAPRTLDVAGWQKLEDDLTDVWIRY